MRGARSIPLPCSTKLHLERETPMPYVTVRFDPEKIPQKTVDKLKPWLQVAVAGALSAKATLPRGAKETDIATNPIEIAVTQTTSHETDVNVAPLEVYIEAGKSKGRSAETIATILSRAINESNLIPKQYLGQGQSCIFIVFHEHNGFQFILPENEEE